MLKVIMNTKHQLVEIRVLFKKTKISLSKSIYFNFKILTKQMLGFFGTRLRGKI